MSESAPDDTWVSHVLQLVAQRDLDALERLRRDWVDFDVCSAEGMTPLHMAAARGYADVARLLISYGVALNRRDARGYTPLALAARHDQVEVLQELLAHGAACNTETAEGYTPLHLAILHGKSCWYETDDTAVCLQRARAPLVCPGAHGRTPLHVAAERGWYAFFPYLLRHGCTIEDRDYRGRTALHVATHRDGGSTIRRLVQEGVSSAVFADNGYTPLGEALVARDYKRLRCLIRSGCSIHELCWNGHTALELARSWQEEKLERYLLAEAAAPPFRPTAAERERMQALKVSRHPAAPRVLYSGMGGTFYQSEEQFEAENLRLATRRAHRRYI